MNHGSLFSGIGGFDLAAEWMGWENVFHCEWNPFGQRVLNYYWPNAISYSDITQTDFTTHRGTIDILTGGFPCQPYSQAGKRLGKEDDRHLWPQMLRAVREIAPRWIVGENVSGLINWNGGLVFDEVQADLEAQGYEVIPFVLPACGVNAPHRRDRIWFIAHRTDAGIESMRRKGKDAVHGFEPATHTNGHVYAGKLDTGRDRAQADGGQSKDQQPDGRDENRKRVRSESGTGSEVTADPGSLGWERWRGQKDSEWQNCGSEAELLGNIKGFGKKPDAPHASGTGRTQLHTPGLAARPGHGTGSSAPDWTDWPTQPPVCSGNDGIPSRLAGITVPKHRNESIKAYGNAVVPQVVYQIFKAIEAYDVQSLTQ